MKKTKTNSASKKKSQARGKKKSRALDASALTEKYQKWFKPIKKPITFRIDADVLDWFQREGDGYQTRINRALRELMLRDKKRLGE